MEGSYLGKRKSRGEVIAAQCSQTEGWGKEDGQPGRFSQRPQSGAVQGTLGNPRKKLRPSPERKEEGKPSSKGGEENQVTVASKPTTEAGKPLGFKNGRNLCYMASILQVLLNFECFVERLKALKDTVMVDKLPEDGVVRSLLALLEERSDAKKKYKEGDCATDLKNIPNLAQNRLGLCGGEQQDATEFYCQLVEAMQAEIITAESESHEGGNVPFSKTKCPASQTFQVSLQTQSAGECNNSQTELQAQWNLYFPVRSESNITNELHKLFHEKEDNRMYCDPCGGGHNFKQGKQLHRLPDVLAIHADRNQIIGKCTSHLTVPSMIEVNNGRVTIPASSITKADPCMGETSSQSKSTCETIVGVPSPNRQDGPLCFVPNSCSQSCENGVESMSGAMLSPEKKQQALVGGAESKSSQSEQNQNAVKSSSNQRAFEVMMPASKEEEQQQVQMAIKASMEDRKNVVSDSFLNEGSQNAPFEKKGNLIEDSMEFDSTCTVFELAGYVSHIGKSVEEGHYKACIKTEMGCWFECNDETVRLWTDGMEKPEEASLFFYRRREKSVEGSGEGSNSECDTKM